MSSSQLLAESSFVKINADNPIVSGSSNFVPLNVGTVGPFFQRTCLFLVFSDVMANLGPAQGYGHTSSLERVPLRRPSRVNRVTSWLLQIHSLPLRALL